jgi:LEA14-like dessication related protein
MTSDTAPLPDCELGRSTPAFRPTDECPGAICFDVGQSDRMRFAMLLAAVVSVVACSGSEPQITPTITPERVSLTKISPAGIELLVEVGVDNPNPIELEARSVSAKVVLDGKHDLDTVEVRHEVELPSDRRTLLAVPLQMDWKDVAVTAALVALHRSVPYDVDGSVSLGGDLVHVSLPFHLSGIITEAELLKAVTDPPPRP